MKSSVNRIDVIGDDNQKLGEFQREHHLKTEYLFSPMPCQAYTAEALKEISDNLYRINKGAMAFMVETYEP